jgi:STE24 endopeptidase
LLSQLDTDEMEAVLAHELGHFHHRHILKMMATSFVVTLLALATLGWLSQQAWFYAGLGVMPHLDGPHDALALLLFLLVTPLPTFFLSPLSAARSRRYEFEADAYARQHSNGPALSRALLKLYRDNASTLTPDPWFVRFYYSHPPAAQRLARMGA